MMCAIKVSHELICQNIFTPLSSAKDSGIVGFSLTLRAASVYGFSTSWSGVCLVTCSQISDRSCQNMLLTCS